MVKNNQFEQGAVAVPPGHPIFQTSRQLYIKELSILQIQAPAQPVLSAGTEVIMATADYGQGRVFALGDPWLYNEYVDGKKLPAEIENFKAARDLSAWLLQKPIVPKPNDETAQVASAVERLRLAMLSGDQKALEDLTDKALSYGHSGGKTEDQQAFIDQLVSGRSDFTTITLTDQTIRIVDKTAIVRHTLTANTNDIGKTPAVIHLAVLTVWVKQKAGWKLLARQAVKQN